MIRGLYKTDVVTITSDKSIKEAATLMKDRNVGDVVVVEGDRTVMPVGILTDRDIVVSCVASGSKDSSESKIADVMSKNVIFIKEHTGLFDAIRVMRENGVGRVLVVDDDQCLLGILTSTTIFDLLNEELHELGMIARSRRSGIQRASSGASSETNFTMSARPDQDLHH